jgi:hypothetical protein
VNTRRNTIRAALALGTGVLFAWGAGCGNGDDNAVTLPPADAGPSDGTLGDGFVPEGGPADAGVDAMAVTFTIDTTHGPARQFKPSASPQRVSPLIYGINAGIDGNSASAYFTAAATRFGLVRQGGDSLSPWNWTNNYSNSGSDYCFFQSSGNGGTALAGLLTTRGDTIPAAQARGEAFLATVPIGDYVSAAYDNATVTCPVTASNCNGGTTASTRVNSGNLPFPLADGGGPAFVPNAASKPGGAFCLCPPGGPCDGGCAPAAAPVYQDEFVHFLKTGYADGGSPLLFDLDNEPNYWGGTHPELWPSTGDLPCQTYSVTYDDIVNRNIEFATAVKAEWPEAVVLGPVVAADGLVYGHTYVDPPAPSEFLDYYLAHLAAASASAGHALIDALDVHFYTNALGGSQPPTNAQCMQTPRLFWDPNYKSLSANATANLDFGWTGVNGYFNREWYPRRLIPRLLAKIDAAYGDAGSPAPGLALTEYNNGCESNIAGGVAQADMLGILGREGMYAAAAFPLNGLWNSYLLAAFDLYRNYDGQGAVVGDTSVLATTSDPVDTSVYAFTQSDDASSVDLVAVNKAAAPVIARVQVTTATTFGHARAYALVDGAAAVVPAAPLPLECAAGVCTLAYTMPPTSATTLVLAAGDDAGPGAVTYVKVDDMEKGTSGPIDLPAPPSTSPGEWFEYVTPASGSSTIAPTPFAYTALSSPHATMPGVSSAHAAHVTCSIAASNGVCQMGFTIAGAENGGAFVKAPVDLTGYAGITFWGRSDTSSTVDVQFPDVDTDPAGGRCGQDDASADQCYDHYEQPASFAPQWQQFTVYFGGLHQAGAPFAWGYTPASGSFDPSQVYGMQFSVASGTLSSGAALQADLWIDDIYLIQRAPAP